MAFKRKKRWHALPGQPRLDFGGAPQPRKRVPVGVGERRGLKQLGAAIEGQRQ